MTDIKLYSKQNCLKLRSIQLIYYNLVYFDLNSTVLPVRFGKRYRQLKKYNKSYYELGWRKKYEALFRKVSDSNFLIEG